MQILTSDTIEKQIGEIDAYLAQLHRKPRKEITKISIASPMFVKVNPVMNGDKVFFGYITLEGKLDNISVQLPMDIKTANMVVELICDNVTTSMAYSLSKGQNSLGSAIDIKANTKVSLVFSSDSIIEEALVGAAFVPKDY